MRRRSVPGWALLAGVPVALSCTPEIDEDPLPAVMEFEATATPPRVPEPSLALVNPRTRRIDLSLGGLTLPADCAQSAPLPQAQCELFKYLETLDGFPTSSVPRAPVSEALDPASLAAPTNVALVEAPPPARVEAAATYDPERRALTVAPARNLEVGRLYWVGVRGYGAGVKAADGRPVVASVAYNLLKREESLTCGAATPVEISPSCPYLVLLAPGMEAAAARAGLARLEQLRQTLANPTLGGWPLMAQAGGIPKAELAVLWGFPTHSASVIELNPRLDLVPKRREDGALRLPVNGTIDPATVRAAAPAAGIAGTVVMIDLTAAAAGDRAGSFPGVAAGVEGKEVLIRPMAALQPGRAYAVFVTRDVLDARGQPFVPPPAAVLLTARGALVTADGKSTVTTISDAEARQLEPGRQALARLLDDPAFAAATGLSRERLAYAFVLTP
jgi:hypothetical protein